MRRHARASSAGPKQRKPSGPGSSPPSGRLKLTILLATVAAFLLVPAAQAAAAGTMTVNIEGSGSGEVSSVGGEFFEIPLEGEPPIECSYASPGPKTGVCEDTMSEPEEGFGGVSLHAVPAPGSEFTAWVVEEGTGVGGCEEPAAKECAVANFGEGNAEVTAIFTATGPTNRRTLTLTKSAGGTGGVGTVKSKPKGINCSSGCNKAVGSFYKESSVTLTAKPATGSSFVKWSNPGGACDESASVTCVMPIAEDESIEALFTGASKAITNPQPLTVSKGESTGYGTVKASGLYCEAECTETTVLYQGPITEPKPKPAKTVELSAAAVYGSEFSGWSGGGCSGTGTCVVTMNEATSVTAEFAAKPAGTLTLNKNSYASGTGTVTSKPKAIKCATTCSTQSASIPQGEAIVLSAKPATGMTFVKWEGDDCEGNVTTTCTVTMDAAETVKAVFSGSPKAIANPQTLTLNKAGSGFGTVKATGLTCEALCTSATSLYAGTVTEPKPKPATTVTLEAFSAPGSKTVVWSGCDSETEGKCVVTMSAVKSVTATFDELE